jgi:hypothetical protein
MARQMALVHKADIHRHACRRMSAREQLLRAIEPELEMIRVRRHADSTRESANESVGRYFSKRCQLGECHVSI